MDGHSEGAVEHHRRLRVVLGTAMLTVALAACREDPAFYPHGESTSGTIAAGSESDSSSVEEILLFVGVPLLLLVALAVLAWLPGMTKSHRYRPQYGWNAEPVWFAGPPDPVAAVEAAQTGDVVRGGAGGSW